MRRWWILLGVSHWRLKDFGSLVRRSVWSRLRQVGYVARTVANLFTNVGVSTDINVTYVSSSLREEIELTKYATKLEITDSSEQRKKVTSC